MNAECEPIHFILNKVFLPLKPTQDIQYSYIQL